MSFIAWVFLSSAYIYRECDYHKSLYCGSDTFKERGAMHYAPHSINKKFLKQFKPFYNCELIEQNYYCDLKPIFADYRLDVEYMIQFSPEYIQELYQIANEQSLLLSVKAFSEVRKKKAGKEND